MKIKIKAALITLLTLVAVTFVAVQSFLNPEFIWLILKAIFLIVLPCFVFYDIYNEVLYRLERESNKKAIEKLNKKIDETYNLTDHSYDNDIEEKA